MILRCMRRKQIYLDDASERGLKRLAAPDGTLGGVAHQRGAAALPGERRGGCGDDPLERLIGLVPDEQAPTTSPEEHDHYLYGAPTEHALRIV